MSTAEDSLWDNVWDDNRKLAFASEVHHTNPIFSKGVRECECYDHSCHKVKTSQTIHGKPKNNLFTTPINPSRENNEIDANLRIQPPEIDNGDVFLFRRHAKLENILIIERMLASVDKEPDLYVSSVKGVRKLIEAKIEELFCEEIELYKKTGRVQSKRYGKRLGELYAGRPVGCFVYNSDKNRRYFRGSMTNILINKEMDIIQNKEIATRTLSVIQNDNHAKFVHQIPFGHFIFLDGTDAEAVSCSKSLSLLVSNHKSLPKNQSYFVGKIKSRNFKDLFGRPSYDIQDLKIDLSSVPDIPEFITEAQEFVQRETVEYPISEYQNEITKTLTIPHQIFNKTCKLHVRKYTVEDVQVQKNREIMGLELNENFPYKQDTKNGNCYERFQDIKILATDSGYDSNIGKNNSLFVNHSSSKSSSSKSSSSKSISFKNGLIKNTFLDKLSLKFERISTGLNTGWVVKSVLDPNEYSDIIPDASVLVGVHRKSLVFEQKNGMKVLIKTPSMKM